jgi:hypothetical protein
MTPPHTPESLLALTKSPEGLTKLNIIGNVFAGTHTVQSKFIDDGELWDVFDSDGCISQFTWLFCGIKKVSRDLQGVPLAPLTTSLGAIFAAEERLGLHDPDDITLQKEWIAFALYVGLISNLKMPLVFLPPPLRLIPFILTAQWKEQNQ